MVNIHRLFPTYPQADPGHPPRLTANWHWRLPRQYVVWRKPPLRDPFRALSFLSGKWCHRHQDRGSVDRQAIAPSRPIRVEGITKHASRSSPSRAPRFCRPDTADATQQTRHRDTLPRFPGRTPVLMLQMQHTILAEPGGVSLRCQREPPGSAIRCHRTPRPPKAPI